MLTSTPEGHPSLEQDPQVMYSLLAKASGKGQGKIQTTKAKGKCKSQVCFLSITSSQRSLPVRNCEHSWIICS